MKRYILKTSYKQILADTTTPVSIYLRLRDKLPNSILLESSDYQGNENSYSFICCNPIASIKVEDGYVKETYPDGSLVTAKMADIDLPERVETFSKQFESIIDKTFNFIYNGLFGYTTYDAVQYFEDIKISPPEASKKIPELFYSVYQYVIAINHFKDELYLFEHNYLKDENQVVESSLEKIEYLIRNKDFPLYKFSALEEENSNFSDAEFIEQLYKVKEHNHRGDVFQLVLSRSFFQKFRGDEFNVYRALRSINPSPYLFYFDYGSFKIFGSSPEAQLIVKGKTAEIHPIAGTFRRTGDSELDLELAEDLKNDPKESSEHVMLVDLARNDLSRNCSHVEVETFKEIQYFSHVIHLVSKVKGKIKEGKSTMKVVADTFPAGTLSGAPKYKAMELINKYERGNRGFYGGCIGFMGFNGYFNHAIMIRSFLSKNNTLHYQAGAGVVADSVLENELNEVNNKLLALKNAIKMAEQLD